MNMNNLTLYELSDNYYHALDFLTDPDNDELPADAIADTLEALGGELEDKAVNVAKFLRNIEANAEAIRRAEIEMSKRRKSLENRVQYLKNYLKGSMEHSGITKIECPYFKLSIQKNPASVNVYNEEAVPPQFKIAVTSWKVDKAAIKTAINSGQTVTGAELTNSTRLAIK
jgi:hypothetical protein